MSNRILIRADDLGWTETINYGIAKTMRDGIIRSMGLMPNMPAACHDWDLVKDLNPCVGQHTCICTGRPLTDPAQVLSICQADGTFKPSKAYRSAQTDFVILDEVVLEIEAQYQRFVEITGRQPHYFEGHAVASKNFFKGFAIVAERHNLPLLPFTN